MEGVTAKAESVHTGNSTCKAHNKLRLIYHVADSPFPVMRPDLYDDLSR